MTRAKSLARTATKKKAALAAAARADVAFVVEKKREIASDFYEIGLALKRLKQPAAFRALGYESFASLCDLALDLSTNQADRFIEVVDHFTLDDARALGVEKAAALADLLAVVPGHQKTHAAIAHGVHLPDGKTLRPKSASVRALESAAKSLRASRPAGGRGRRLSAADAKTARALEKNLHAAGAKNARVLALAGYAGHPAHVRIELEIGELSLLGRALR